jgi:hypothetical protein
MDAHMPSNAAPEPPPYDVPPDHWHGEPEVDLPSPPCADQHQGRVEVAASGPLPRDGPMDLPAPPLHQTDNRLKPEAPARVLPTILFVDAAAALDADDFLEGVLTRGAMSVVYGESNSGKTFFALDLALHVAAGRQWRDREAEQGFVLYLALEGSQGIRNRIAAYKLEHGFEDTNPPFAIAAVGVNLLDPDADASAVIATIKSLAETMAVKPILIVVDTLARAMAGGNENSSEDMGALVINGDTIRRETGAHVMWIHHSGKDAAKGARGHSSLRAATDTEIEVVSMKGARTATVTKQRDMECSGSFGFTLKVVELGKNKRGKMVTSCVVEVGEGDAAVVTPAQRLSNHQQRALEVLGDAIGDGGRVGEAGVPAGMPSVPEALWRQRFYERAAPGADAEAKKKAFRRAADALVERHLVGMAKGRVWVVRSPKPAN